jgi:hypothetical protein
MLSDLVKAMREGSLPAPIMASRGVSGLLKSQASLMCALPIPDFRTEDGEIVKAASLPLVDDPSEYKRLSIYTLMG